MKTINKFIQWFRSIFYNKTKATPASPETLKKVLDDNEDINPLTGKKYTYEEWFIMINLKKGKSIPAIKRMLRSRRLNPQLMNKRQGKQLTAYRSMRLKHSERLAELKRVKNIKSYFSEWRNKFGIPKILTPRERVLNKAA